MTDKDTKLSELLNTHISSYKKEKRYLEFKSNHLSVDRIGEYISALSNGACLDGEEYGYLYFGIDNDSIEIKGTTFDFEEAKAKGEQSLELTLRREITPKINFKFDQFTYFNGKKVVRLRIPSAKGQPTLFCWKGFIRVNSHNTALEQYPEWMRYIYNSDTDWSSEPIEDATIQHLDPQAIQVAREGYKQRHPDYADESDKWSDSVFLDKAELTLDGQITRATMLLVGKKEYAHKIPHLSQIVWSCFQDGETFGDIFSIPFILSTTELLGRIRNYRFKIYPPTSLIPADVWKYDTRSILEALHNCIAHQDYTLNERIIVNESKDGLRFENAGNFYVGHFQDYIEGEKRPRKYRNRALMNAMVNIKMIDSQGYGIHNLFVRQKERFLPMPDYDGTTESHVVLNMPGVIIDENYSLILMSNIQISLTEAYLLDQVQKGKILSSDSIDLLRKKHLVEGRKPRVYLTKTIAQKVGEKVEYTKHKGLVENSLWHSLESALKDHEMLSRDEIDLLLCPNLSDKLDEKQKKSRIKNFLAKWKKAERIDYKKVGKHSLWFLVGNS